jgi:deoxyribose-phosphate aldolase
MNIERLIQEVTREVMSQANVNTGSKGQGALWGDNTDTRTAETQGLTSYDIAQMIDHSLLHPSFTDRELEEECRVAAEYHAASVCVKPYHTKRASELLAGTDVKVCAVIAFPHGNSAIDVKLCEAAQVIKDGAVEVDMVVNLGKLMSRDWDYIEKEIREINSLTVGRNAILKVIFENDLIPDDDIKITLCRICSKYKVAYVKTSTGYNFVKGADGKYTYKGATEHDLKLMRANSSPEVQVKAAGSVGNLDAILAVRRIGITRIGTKGLKKIVEDAKRRFGK